LGSFISRSGDRCKVFFDLLKKKKDLIWTEECQVASDQLKLFLTQPPIMSIPKRGEPLYLYLAVSDCAISSVLIREELKIQHPVFYFSKTLRDSELRYSTLEKLAYALLLSSKRLRPYFQGHPIHVLTNAPLGLVMKDPGATGRVAKWAMKLKEFDIYYAPRPAIKAQVLADFIVEMSTPLEDPKLASDSQVGPGVKLWNLHTDGSSNSAGNGAGIVLTSPDGAKLEYSLKLLFPATNNVAEYEALIAGVRIARSLGAEVLKAHTDSELVANQINGEYEARDETMSAYLAKVKQITSTMGHFEVTHIPRNLNHMADALARLASAAEDDSFAGTILREELRHPSTEEDEVNLVEEPQDNWMSAIRRFLIEGTLPEDKKKAEALKRRSTRFILINSQLYRKGFTTPLLKCLGPEAAAQVLQEIHEGTCSSHVGPRTLAQKVFRQGYWWPSVMADAEKYVLSCTKCQEFARVTHLPAGPMINVVSPWPFMQWGIDLVGPLPQASRQRRFIIVAIDYFTKWIEAEPLASITGAAIAKFFRNSVIYRFGIPKYLVSDNGSQFASPELRELCGKYNITQKFTSVYHPQANGQVENANRTILDGLKKRLEGAKGTWPDILPTVLWAYRTTHRTSTGETPFSLSYGTEAVIPTEVYELCGTPKEPLVEYLAKFP
jgi:ribonuclease HI